jgi:hypothetical protein
LNQEYSKAEGFRLDEDDGLLSVNLPPRPATPRNLSVRDLLPDWAVAIRAWRKAQGPFPSIFRPRTFNEKILHRILFDRRPILTEFADKAAVRRYVEQRLGPEILPELYHLTSDPGTIPFDDLPRRFVAKPTHGSGWVELVPDKFTLDRDALIRTCRDWLGQSLYRMTREWAYKHIEPRIMIEEYIDDGSAAEPSDYKLFVFDGVVEFIHIDVGRFGDHRRRLFTPQWQEMDVSFGGAANVVGEVPRPAHLAAMIRAAEILGRDVDFVRADFYDTGERLYFGELTMTPGCGHNRFHPRAFDRYLGGRWNQRTR